MSQANSTMTVARQLAEFVIGQAYEDLPSQAIDHAEMLIASTVSSAAAGAEIETPRIIRRIEVDRGGRPEATAWFGAAEQLPVVAAARINAMMSDAAASDDSDLRNIVHQGTTACATALAIGEKTGASGKDVLAAIVLGYEAAGRISTAMGYGFKNKGFHGGNIAGFAATVAAARLLGMSAVQTMHAISLTATSGGGLMVASNTGSAREYHAGNAVIHGIEAALAAARGYTSEEAILEAPKGYLAAYGDQPDVAAVTRDFGTRWNILTELGIKLVPGGHPSHAVGEAAAKAAIEGNVLPDEVESITIGRPGFQGFAVVPDPTDLAGMAQSPIYFAAAGVADKGFNWTHATQAKLQDPAIRALLPRVRMGDPPTENLERYKSGAVVTIRTRDGRSHSSTVYAPKGAAMIGIDWADVEAKYRTLVPHARPSSGNLEASLRVIRRFRDLRRVSELTSLLC
jgi:2-methylcitrate dehydratase PrpD